MVRPDGWHAVCHRLLMRLRWQHGPIVGGLALALVAKAGGNAGPVEVPFEFSEGLIWVRVTSDQASRPLAFLLDSGASVSVLHTPTARALGVKPGPEVRVCGVGIETRGSWPSQWSARLGDLDLAQPWLVLDLGELSAACGRPVDGLLGLDFFAPRVVQVDFDARVLRCAKQAHLERGDTSLPLRVRQGGACVPVRVNEGPVEWLRLDTGCASSVEWVTAGPAPDSAGSRLSVGLTRITRVQATTRLQLGALEFDRVPTGVHRQPIFPGEAGLLGNGLLAGFSAVTIDVRSGRIHLREKAAHGVLGGDDQVARASKAYEP
jgi:hypothetical protein